MTACTDLCFFFPYTIPPSSSPHRPPPIQPQKAWLLNKWKKTFYNIKGTLFRKGRPCWGAEEACLLTLDTSYLRQLQMDPPLVIPALCQVGLSSVATLMWTGVCQRIRGSFGVNVLFAFISLLGNFFPFHLRDFCNWAFCPQTVARLSLHCIERNYLHLWYKLREEFTVGKGAWWQQ